MRDFATDAELFQQALGQHGDPAVQLLSGSRAAQPLLPTAATSPARSVAPHKHHLLQQHLVHQQQQQAPPLQQLQGPVSAPAGPGLQFVTPAAQLGTSPTTAAALAPATVLALTPRQHRESSETGGPPSAATLAPGGTRVRPLLAAPCCSQQHALSAPRQA